MFKMLIAKYPATRTRDEGSLIIEIEASDFPALAEILQLMAGDQKLELGLGGSFYLKRAVKGREFHKNSTNGRYRVQFWDSELPSQLASVEPFGLTPLTAMDVRGTGTFHFDLPARDDRAPHKSMRRKTKAEREAAETVAMRANLFDDVRAACGMLNELITEARVAGFKIEAAQTEAGAEITLDMVNPLA